MKLMIKIFSNASIYLAIKTEPRKFGFIFNFDIDIEMTIEDDTNF